MSTDIVRLILISLLLCAALYGITLAAVGQPGRSVFTELDYAAALAVMFGTTIVTRVLQRLAGATPAAISRVYAVILAVVIFGLAWAILWMTYNFGAGDYTPLSGWPDHLTAILPPLGGIGAGLVLAEGNRLSTSNATVAYWVIMTVLSSAITIIGLRLAYEDSKVLCGALAALLIYWVVTSDHAVWLDRWFDAVEDQVHKFSAAPVDPGWWRRVALPWVLVSASAAMILTAFFWTLRWSMFEAFLYSAALLVNGWLWRRLRNAKLLFVR